MIMVMTMRKMMMIRLTVCMGKEICDLEIDISIIGICKENVWTGEQCLYLLIISLCSQTIKKVRLDLNKTLTVGFPKYDKM